MWLKGFILANYFKLTSNIFCLEAGISLVQLYIINMVFGLPDPQIPNISNMNFNPGNMLNDVSSTFSNLLSLQMTSGGNMKWYLLGGAGVVLYLLMK